MVCGNLLAQTDSTVLAKDKCPIHKGVWEIKLGMGDALTRRGTSYILQGGYHFTDNFSFHLAFNGQFHNFTEDQQNYSDRSSDNPPENKHRNNNHQIEVSFQYCFYPSIKNGFFVYYGGGPLIALSHYLDSSTNYTVDPSFNSWRSQENYYWGFGISGVFGVEWFATRHFGISAEFGGILEYSYNLEKTKSWSNYDGNSLTRTIEKGFNGSLQDVLVGISVYF